LTHETVEGDITKDGKAYSARVRKSSINRKHIEACVMSATGNTAENPRALRTRSIVDRSTRICR
jgi:hypothetical protein